MHLVLELGKTSDLELRFEILSTPVAQLWLERMQQRHAWPLDDPQRFYGFDTPEVQHRRAREHLQRCVDTINAYDPIIDRLIPEHCDQDLLNYLHWIFETYHGQLDCQTSAWWRGAPVSVQQALAQLNIAVHRYESLGPSRPRLVCTWWGMPKSHTLAPDLCERWGERGRQFGSVYLNYCEIGKTLWELARDQDDHAGQDMFLPFSHYSADFVISFYDDTPELLAQQQQLIDRYWHQRRDFFLARGVTSPDHWRAQQMQYKVAELVLNPSDTSSIIRDIAANQWVANVYIE